MKLRRNRVTEREGVNAVQAFFERCRCVFQPVDNSNDYGKDAYVDLADEGHVTGICVALQIKSGASYRRSSGYAVPIDDHANVWRQSTIPIAGIIYDPDSTNLYWCDITSFLKTHAGNKLKEVPVDKRSILTPATLETDFKPQFRRDLHLIETPRQGEPTVFRFPGAARPHDLLHYKESIIVANWDAGNLAFVDPVRRTIDAAIPLDRYESTLNPNKSRKICVYEPGPLAVASDKLFLGQVFSDNILVVDLESRSVVKRVQVPGGGDGSIAASLDGTSIYFASNTANSLFVINTSTYETQSFPYPCCGRGSISIATWGDSRVLVGVQRGFQSSVGTPNDGGCFLAEFDLRQRAFIHSVPLSESIEGKVDFSSPACILPDARCGRVYVGMFQGIPGIYLLEGAPLQIVRSSRPKRNSHNKYFNWVDPLAMQLYKGSLLAIHRNNCELVLLDRETLTVKRTSFLGEAPNGPKDLLVYGSTAIISYPEKGGLLFLDLEAETLWR